MGCVVLVATEVHKKDGKDKETTTEMVMTCPLCRSNDDDDKAILNISIKRAEGGHHHTILRIGEYYFTGKWGLKQDKAEGLKWYHRALEAGSGNAAYHLGYCYVRGNGVDKDIQKALGYFRKAIDLGYIPAFYNVLSILVERGEMEEVYLNVRKAAMCGLSEDKVFNALSTGYTEGYITKDEYALRVLCKEFVPEWMNVH